MVRFNYLKVGSILYFSILSSNTPVSEFNEFELRLKSAKKPVSIERRIKSLKIEDNFKWNNHI